MKINIPVVGNKNGKPVLDDMFEHVCEVARLNISSIIGCPSKNIEDRARPFIIINDKIAIRKKYENVPREILDIYPNRPSKILVYFVEIDIDDNRIDLLTEEETKLISI